MEKKHTIIIAEAGVNHNGSMELAKQLIDVAAEAGADYVKFQTFKSDKIASAAATKAEYQKRDNESDSQLDLIRKLELSQDQFIELADYCNGKQVGFLSTGFDDESLDFLNDLRMPFFKIPSGELTNLPYLLQVAGFGKLLILSTGMATMEEVKNSVEVLIASGANRQEITVLHCNTDYPTQMSDVNLLAMNHLRATLDVEVGYSDHTLGIEIPIAAVALGARVIEKHFTLDRSMDGPDHKASLLPTELKAMVTAIRNVEVAMAGSGTKEPSERELKNSKIARKSIHLAREISLGERLQTRHLIMLRPGDGISPMQLPNILGKEAMKNLSAGHKLDISDFK